MTERVAMKVEGAEDLLKALRALGENVDKSVKGATRAGGKMILRAARSNAKALSHRSGRAVQLRVRKRKGFAVASITPAKGFAHLRLLEYGAQPHDIQGNPMLRFFSGGRLLEVRSVHHPGFAARPWLRPAFDASKEAALAAVGEALADTLERAKIAAEGSDE